MDTIKNPKNVKAKKVDKIRTPHFGWRRFVWFLIGFVSLPLSLAGTVAAGGFLFKTGDVLRLTGVDPDTILTVDYQNLTVSEIAMKIISGEIKFETLQDIANITPYLDTVINQLSSSIEGAIGYSINTTELYSKGWSEIGQYLIDDVTNGIKLDKILGVTEEGNDILKYLVFPKNDDGTYDYDNGRSVKFFMDGGLNDLLDNATVGDLLGSDGSPLMNALKDCHIMTIGSDIQNVKLGDLLGVDENSEAALQYLGNYTIATINDAIANAKISNFIDIVTDPEDPNYVPFMAAIGNIALSEVGAKLPQLTIGEMIGAYAKENPPMKAFASFTLQDFMDGRLDLESVKIGDLIEVPDEEPVGGYSLIQKIVIENPNATINDLTDSVKSMKIKDLVGSAADGSFLKPFENYTINQLMSNDPSEKPTIVLGMFLTEDFMEDPEHPGTYIVKPGRNPAGVLKVLCNSTLDSLSTDIDDIALGDVLDCSGNKILEYLSDAKIGGSSLSDKMNNMTIGDCVDLGDNPSKILAYLADKKVTELSTAIDSLKVGDVMEDDGSAIYEAFKDDKVTEVLSNIADKPLSVFFDADSKLKTFLETNSVTLSNFDEKLDLLTLGDILDESAISGSKLLQALKDTAIKDMGTKLNDLTVADVLEGADDNKFLKCIPSTTKISEIGDAITGIKFVDAFREEIWEKDPSVQAKETIEDGDIATMETSWKFLLGNYDGSTKTWSFVGKDYTLGGNLSDMIHNMTTNVSVCSLFELKKGGLIDVDDETLNKTLISTGEKVGNLTISQLISSLGAALA